MKIVMCFAALAFLLVFYGLAVHNTPETEAVMATDFQAGRIIDDAVFYDANTMSVEEIQAFLDAKLPTCDMWGTGSSAGRVVSETGYVMPAGSTNADYARLRAAAGNSRYHEPPYICVNKYYENPETHETLYETNGIVKDGMISAAQIIYNEAQRYSINPQVLLVLLKKESYVWGDTWPLKWEYNSAMGYGCPDTAPCDTAYYGFYNQVHMAAYQFDRYKQKNYEYNYHPGMTNNIYYSPTYSCGTKQVYIENMATASLYIYTPYTPNDAALQNYPGTSYCGSYGNRNFFMYFSEWFGSTYIDSDLMAINAAYKDLGDDARALGKPISDVIHGQLSTWVKYENGYIVGAKKTGFYISIGKIREVWAANNYEAGVLGLPLSNIRSNDKMQWQKFQNGYIVGSEETGYFVSMGKIREVWGATGYEAGALGRPTSEVLADDNDREWQEYEHGCIIGSDESGYYAIFEKYYEIWKDYKISDEKTLGVPLANIRSNDKMQWQKYQNGYIVGSDATGFYVSTGKIREVWGSTGYEAGILGLPIQEIRNNETYGSTWQKYQNGYIVGSDATGFYVSTGKIREVWGALGYESGVLGLPTSNIQTSGNRITQSYQHGLIACYTSNNKCSYEKR